MTEFDADQIVEGITRALVEQRIEVIPGLVKLLAAADPLRARQVLAAMETGIELHGGKQ